MLDATRLILSMTKGADTGAKTISKFHGGIIRDAAANPIFETILVRAASNQQQHDGTSLGSSGKGTQEQTHPGDREPDQTDKKAAKQPAKTHDPTQQERTDHDALSVRSVVRNLLECQRVFSEQQATRRKFQ